MVVEDVQAALRQIVSASDIEDIIIVGTKGYVHLSSPEAKAHLLKEKRVSIKSSQEKEPAPTPEAPSQQPLVKSSAFQKVLLLSPLPPKGCSSMQVLKVLDNDCKFLTVKNGKGFAEYRNEASYNKAIEKGSITVNNSIVSTVFL
jgi:hypothetical protein